ncbi:hypothetical protein [Bacillus wiedmannii]|nr:hypothetical protein [Bacillus wiedmannii]
MDNQILEMRITDLEKNVRNLDKDTMMLKELISCFQSLWTV